MKHLPATLLLAGVLAAAPAYAQSQPPARAQQSAAVPKTAPAATPDTPATANDDVFERARRLMAAGQEESGRALVQSELNSADSGSARYVEALYWRAVLAKTAADAERDLRTIVIDYPLAPESDDALMRLAQLEMTRGENDQAMGHLQRVVREHSRSASRPRASFWMARMLFDKGDSIRACARLADASATTPAGEVELRNQIDYLSPRCVGVDTSTTPGAAGAQPRTGKPPAAKPPAVIPPATIPPVAKATAARPTATKTTAAKPTHAPVQGAPAAQSAGGQVAPASAAAHSSAATRQSQEFTVQVAAFSSQESAERIRQRLTDLGYDARVTGGAPPYRVRVGRYPTRAAADSIAARMKTQHVDGYVTGAEPRR